MIFRCLWILSEQNVLLEMVAADKPDLLLLEFTEVAGETM